MIEQSLRMSYLGQDAIVLMLVHSMYYMCKPVLLPPFSERNI